jgi:P-type Cu2+ transporter
MLLALRFRLRFSISTLLGAQNGLLIKDRLALERARNLDMVNPAELPNCGPSSD